jgi:4-hydroxythreonine-4-phosphate dehydrogenase
MESKRTHISVGITMGDPSGIGPEIIAKALKETSRIASIVVIGDRYVFEKSARHIRIPSGRFEFIDMRNVSRSRFAFGKVRAEYGRASLEYLDKAMECIEEKKINCLVTCPISKEALHLAGFKYRGHTEYLKEKTRTRDEVMMLLNDRLRFSIVTRHIALRDVASRLTIGAIATAVKVTYRSLQELFLIPKPKIGVCGLNPHASDNGLLGDEENKIIKPALRATRIPASFIEGPLPADVAVAKACRREYDALIAMYHDQALIPLKMQAAHTGVNITLGLPFVRTSPLHGTAFDIAGKGSADPRSLVASITLAIQCALNQKRD